MKRAHLRAVEMLKPLAAEFDMTPARFDVMYVLRMFGGVTNQSRLWQFLGVSRKTMSKMVKGMEEKGLVWRRVDPDNARERDVIMTKYGIEQFFAAAKRFLRGDELRDMLDGAMEDGREFVAHAADVARYVAEVLGDTARHLIGVETPDEATNAVRDEYDADAMGRVERFEHIRPPPPARSAEEEDGEDGEGDEALRTGAVAPQPRTQGLFPTTDQFQAEMKALLAEVLGHDDSPPREA
ncbi:MAG: MarR family transcriptional regulator [Labilithrix sp.]|nr:MarR family transcriptional regulator [Labilithrix sp.]